MHAICGLSPVNEYRQPWGRYVLRRVVRSLVAAGLLILLLPWLFIQQDMAQESRAKEDLALFSPPKPRRTLSPDEERASQAVLAYRACSDGPTIQQIVDSSMIGGRLGVVHFRSGSIVTVSNQDAAEYLVDVIIETHDAGYADGRPRRFENPIGFTHDSRTGRVAGRDASGQLFMESARWECVRDVSPWRRGPPQPVETDP